MPEQTIILVRRRADRRGWEAYESEGVRPFFAQRQMAVDYAMGRTPKRSGEIRVFNDAGELELTVPFDERFRRD